MLVAKVRALPFPPGLPQAKNNFCHVRLDCFVGIGLHLVDREGRTNLCHPLYFITRNLNELGATCHMSIILLGRAVEPFEQNPAQAPILGTTP